MSLLRSVKGMIFEEAAPTSDTSVGPLSPNSTSQPRPAVQVAPSVYESQSYLILAEAVLSRDSAYTRFLKKVKALQNRIQNETDRFSAALAVAEADGIGKEEILKAIATHMVTLNNERTKFESALQQELDTQVGIRKRDSDNIDRSIGTHQQEIVRLQGEIAKLEGEKARLQAEIHSHESRIINTKREFEPALGAVESKIKADQAKLESIKT